MLNPRNIKGHVTALHGLLIDAITAGGGGDNVEAVGIVIDRLNTAAGARATMPLSGILAIPFEAVLAAGETLTFKNIRVYHDDAAGFGTKSQYALLSASTVVATGPVGGGTVTGIYTGAVNLDGAKRYVALAVTPDLSAGGADTANINGVFVLGGFDTVPPSIG